MVATPKYGGMFFKGRNGATYPIDIYVSDVNSLNKQIPDLMHRARFRRHADVVSFLMRH